MRPITDVLREIRKGRVVEAATEDLQALVRAVQETGKPGVLTLKLKVTPKPGDTEAVILSAAVETKQPKASLPDAIFFPDAEGDLHREDPNQREIFEDTEALGHVAERKRR